MKDIELIIFDMDGLMFDTEKMSYQIWQEVLGKYNYEFNFTIFSKMLGTSLVNLKKVCLQEYGDDFPFELIKEERYKLTKEIIEKEGLPLKKGLLELLEFLKPYKIKKAVATSSIKERTELFFDGNNLASYFDLIITGDEVSKSKPDPEIFLTVAKKLNCDATKTIVLEDSFAGITAAYKAKMLPILVPDLKEPNQEIIDMCFQIFPSLVEVQQYLAKILSDDN